MRLYFVSDLSRLRCINVSLVKFLLRTLSVVPTLVHMVLNPVHQFALLFSTGVDMRDGDCVVKVVAMKHCCCGSCFSDGVDVTKSTLEGFVGFVVS